MIMNYSGDTSNFSEADNYAAGTATGSSINLRHYWYVLLERRWLVVCSYLAVLTLAGIYLYTAPRVYRATTRLQIDPESDSSLNLKDVVVRMGPIDPDYLQTQYRNLMSWSLLATVVQKERLNDDPRYSKNMDVSKALANDITIAPLRLTRLVDVSVDHTSPKKAMEIANTLANEFIDVTAAQKQERTASMLFFLKNQANGLEGEVSKAEEDLQNYRMRKKYVSLEKGDNIIAEALSQAQSRYAEAKARAQTAQTTVDELDKHIQAGKPLSTFPPLAADASLKALEGQRATLETDLAGLLKKYKDKHPAVIQLRSQLAENKAATDRQAQQLAGVLRSEAELSKGIATTLLSNVADFQNEQMEWNQAKMEYDRLWRIAQSKTALYNALLAKMSEIDVVQKDKQNNIHVVYAATTPLAPVKPNIPITIALAAVGGLAVALGLALFVNFLDDSIKSQDDVETYLRLPFLGYLPNIKSASLPERYQHAHMHPQSNAAESFRTVRAAITLGSRGDKFRIFTVTSSVPAEGKSTVAANMAIVIAQTGLRTLLVDADFRRPSLHQGFGMRGVTGLVAYLAGKVATVDETVQTTEVPNLDLVCCGSTPSQPSELLSSKRMAEFVQEAGRRYDRVIIDCPPVSAVSDPLIVSSLADGVVLVTKFNKVRRDVARKSIQRILDAGLQICGVVINDIDFEGRDAYYYSYYYYQNRYYKGYYHSKAEALSKDESVPAAADADKKLVS